MAAQLLEHYIKQIIKYLGVDSGYVDAEKKKWERDFGSNKTSDNDFIWTLYNRLIHDSSSKYNNPLALYQHLRQIYFQMWVFLTDEGRKSDHVYKQMLYCDLMQANANDYQTNVSFITTKCCPACDTINKQKMPLEQAIKEQPLPYKHCTRTNGCICRYGIEPVRNQKGQLMPK